MAHAMEAQPDDARMSPTSPLEIRKRDLQIKRLELCRDTIADIDSADKESWRKIIEELLEGGFDLGELEAELAASGNTIYKWRTGLAAPREMTRRLLHRAILEMVDDRIKSVRHAT